jgi:hypothetical protein
MDISGISAAVSTAAQADTASAVQMAVLKKALDMEGQSALQLVQAATQMNYNNPPNLGNKVDTLA